MTVLKMNALLAKVDHGASIFRKMTAEFKVFFDKGEGAFKGIRKTFIPREGMADNPSMRQYSQVVTTVTEKLKWYEENAVSFIDSTLAIDATNAQSHLTKVPLIVGGVILARMSTLELMKLKSILTKMGLEDIYTHIPVRSDAIIWGASDEEAYQGREIFEGELIRGVTRGGTKVEFVLEDPNLKYMIDSGKVPDVSKYTPPKGIKDSLVETGDYTAQEFSGQMTQRQKAEILQRRSNLLEAIEIAIKQANDVATVSSEMSSGILFNYIHRGVLPQQNSL